MGGGLVGAGGEERRRVGEASRPARDAVERELDSWLARRGGDRLAAVDSWALANPGKLVRPVLLLESAGAVGGSWPSVLPAAVAVELTHVGSLLHDDVLDGDDLRRGRASVHRKFGAELAILGGDGLLFAAFQQVVRCFERGVAADAVQRAVAVLAAAGRDLAAGVAGELDFSGAAPGGGAEAALAAYTEIARLKTAALLRASCEMGAVLGGGGSRQTQALADYGEALGIAFQIRDDLLPYTAGAARTGKPVDSDLRNARPSLPLLLVGALGGEGAQARLSALAAQDSDTRQAELVELLEETGALKQARLIAQDYALLCHTALDEIAPGPHRDVLRDLIGIAEVAEDTDPAGPSESPR